MSEQQVTYKRKKKLVDPKVQGNLILLTLFSAGVAVLVHASLTALLLSNLASNVPNDGREIVEALPSTVITGSLLALVVTVPLFAMLGISATFRVFGPLYRFRVFLEGVVKGEHPEPCRIRKDDHFQDLCDLLNQATEAVRAKSEKAGDDVTEEQRQAA